MDTKKKKKKKKAVLKGVLTMVVVALAGFCCSWHPGGIPISRMSWRAYSARRQPRAVSAARVR